MDTRSEFLLLSVDPDLARVLRKTSQEPQAFRIVQGKRSLENQKKALQSGNSQTLHSRHLGGKDGLSDAVDVVALTNGKIDWAVGHEAEVYGQIYKQIKSSSDELSIPIEWGGHFKSWKDWGHYQLPWSLDRE